MEEEQGVSLETLGQGAAVERFNLALQDVLNNVQDPNTDPNKARTVTMKVTVKPSADREVGTLAVDVVSKLAPIAPFDVRVFMGRDKDGKGYATEYHSQQAGLFTEPVPEAENVKHFEIKKEVKA